MIIQEIGLKKNSFGMLDNMSLEYRVETCTHCGFIGSYNNLKKEHYDNCVFKNNNNFEFMYDIYLEHGFKGSLSVLNIPGLTVYKLKEILKFKKFIKPINEMSDAEFILYLKRLNKLKISSKTMDKSRVCNLGGYNEYDESLYALINDFTKTNTCVICGEQTKFRSLSTGYNITCSDSCQGQLRASYVSKSSIEKASHTRNQTMMAKYNINNISQKNIKNMTDLRNIVFLKKNFLSEHGYVLSKEFNDYFNTSLSLPYKIFNELNIEYKKGSSIQVHLNEWLNNIGIETMYCDRTIIKPYELDIVIPKFKLAIEYCGVYWHRHGNKKDKNYHLNKLKLCKDANYSLITVFDTDDLDKIKLLILSRLGKLSIKYARKCTVKEISSDESSSFNDQYHLSSHTNSSINIGLFDEDNTLIQVMTLGKPRFSKKYQYELLRFTSGNISVTGGASKLFKYFVSSYKPISIISYCDLRFGVGKVYKMLGFEDDGFTGVNYKYIINGQLQSREKFQKHKLKNILKHFNENMTEYENMLINGYDKIYDCGNQRYIWQK